MMRAGLLAAWYARVIAHLPGLTCVQHLRRTVLIRVPMQAALRHVAVDHEVLTEYRLHLGLACDDDVKKVEEAMRGVDSQAAGDQLAPQSA